VVKKCTPGEFKDCDLVFSGLDSDVAGDVGMEASQAEFHNTDYMKKWRSSSPISPSSQMRRTTAATPSSHLLCPP
jgi:hypothetical protein